jgi:hypothetical protein
MWSRSLKAFLAGVVAAALIALATGIACNYFEITAEAYFSTQAARP